MKRYDLLAKRLVTVALISIAELGCIIYGVMVFTDFAHLEVPYSWIVIRLIVTIVGMFGLPIIISHGIQRIDNFLTRSGG